MDATEAIYKVIADTILADTTNNVGLSAANGLGNQVLKGGFYRPGDPARTTNSPRIKITVTPTNQDQQGGRGVEALVRFKIEEKTANCAPNLANPYGFTRPNAIVERLNTLFNASASYSNPSGWTFRKPVYQRDFPIERDSDNIDTIVEFTMGVDP